MSRELPPPPRPPSGTPTRSPGTAQADPAAPHPRGAAHRRGHAAALAAPHPQAEATDEPPRVLGQIRTVSPQSCPAAEGENEEASGPPTPTIACGSVTVTLTSGREAGTDVTTDIPSGPGAPRLHAGDKVTLLLLDDATGGGKSYSIIDFQRSHRLWLLGAAFALAVIAFARWRGVTALAGLAVTFAVLLLFIIPAILDGRSPVLVAVVGSAAIMLTVLYLTHGFTTTTSVAVAGTLISLTITALLSGAATAAAHLSGVADETASYLSIAYQNVDMRGLLLAGIVIGSLGVLDDVTVTQSATVTELAAANPSYRFRELYRAGTRIGRAHIASVINTIVLAYAGASLPLMLLFAAGNTPVGDLLTGELVAQELVRSAVGTIGLITAVPITTALAALVASRARDTGLVGADRAQPERHAPPREDPWVAFAEDDARW
ncbi:YibE/F family protein [Micromonospora globispora]|uniref:YibE/F family protein n=1 Tax=Micromonospora globispora TaxID=1450148 RepID=UPI001FAF53CE|nr:YibE/F family protein [Micromonospora globispora]